MPLLKMDGTNYYEQIGLLHKGREITQFAVCYDEDLEATDLLNILDLICYQHSFAMSNISE